MKGRDAYGLVLSGLRERLLRGDIAPGQALSIVDLAAEFGTSITPVREALARLSGEGLVGGARRSGFVRPTLDEEGLGDLYDLHHSQVDWAVRQLAALPDRAPHHDSRPSGLLDPVAFFAGIVALSRNRALVRAHRLTAHGLGSARRAERLIMENLDEELGVMAVDLAGHRLANLREHVDGYHARRRMLAARLIESFGPQPQT